MKIPPAWIDREIEYVCQDNPTAQIVVMGESDIDRRECIHLYKTFDVYDLLLHDISIINRCIFIFSNPSNDTMNSIDVLKPIVIIGIYRMIEKNALSTWINNNDYLTTYCEHIRGDVLHVWRSFNTVICNEGLSLKALSYINNPYQNEWC